MVSLYLLYWSFPRIFLVRHCYDQRHRLMRVYGLPFAGFYTHMYANHVPFRRLSGTHWSYFQWSIPLFVSNIVAIRLTRIIISIWLLSCSILLFITVKKLSFKPRYQLHFIRLMLAFQPMLYRSIMSVVYALMGVLQIFIEHYRIFCLQCEFIWQRF